LKLIKPYLRADANAIATTKLENEPLTTAQVAGRFNRMLSVAAIDVGSNATRLVAVRIGMCGTVQETYAQRYAVRLGAEVFAMGHIGPECEAALIDVFTDCAARLRELGVERYRAVATSAMRDAANAAAVVAAIRLRTGIELEIISGAEEGRLMRLTLMRALGTVPKDALLVDLGGGSLELERTSGLRGKSLPFGTVRLLQRYPGLREPLGARDVQAIGASLRDELQRLLRQPRAAQLAIGTGGNLDVLARLVPVAGMAVPAIDLRALRALSVKLAGMTTAERAQRFHLRADRADIILPAALVMIALADIFGLRALLVPGTGLRESILQSLVAEETVNDWRLSRWPAKNLNGCRRQTAVARQLFHLLGALHRLWPPAITLLEAASLCHESCTSARDAREAARKIRELLATPALGDELEPEAQRLVACAAVLAFGARRPSSTSALSDSERAAARTLAAIVRLSAALCERSAGSRLKVSLLKNPIEIEVGLSRRLPRAAVEPLERALKRRIRVL
jgi:exopolyphosphatase / guanosine-5'-triphosphate,3'-diphosphate pyrophosphatase